MQPAFVSHVLTTEDGTSHLHGQGAGLTSHASYLVTAWGTLKGTEAEDTR